MKNIVVSGSSGLIGKALCSKLSELGFNIIRLVRKKSLTNDRSFFWDPMEKIIDQSAFRKADFVVNLSGEPIAQNWNTKSKKLIYESRILGTRLIVESLKRAKSKAVLISSSGINFYGSNVGYIEEGEYSSISGNGFLKKVCKAWELEAVELEKSAQNNRVVLLRTGVVLSIKGGALKRMLPPFRMGLGGPVGNGYQLMSWIELNDLVKIILYAINEDISGPINAVAPQPVENRLFSQILAKEISRPSFLPMPEWAVKILFGEMARETILANIGITPRVLSNLGFRWDFPTLESALKKALLNGK